MSNRNRILVIEDEAGVRTLICRALTRAGYEVVGAGDGLEGIRQFSATAFDLIITDIVMPETNGMEVISFMRKQNPSLPVIAISGGGMMEAELYLKMATAMGVSAVLRKPFDVQSLIEIVAQNITPGKSTDDFARKAA